MFAHHVEEEIYDTTPRDKTGPRRGGGGWTTEVFVIRNSIMNRSSDLMAWLTFTVDNLCSNRFILMPGCHTFSYYSKEFTRITRVLSHNRFALPFFHQSPHELQFSKFASYNFENVNIGCSHKCLKCAYLLIKGFETELYRFYNLK